MSIFVSTSHHVDRGPAVSVDQTVAKSSIIIEVWFPCSSSQSHAVLGHLTFLIKKCDLARMRIQLGSTSVASKRKWIESEAIFLPPECHGDLHILISITRSVRDIETDLFICFLICNFLNGKYRKYIGDIALLC